MAKTWAEAEPLIEEHIKRVSIGAIQDRLLLKFFREFVGAKRSGIYVLRRGKGAYYVGLSGSLRWRLPKHLSDPHQGKWDRFDLYVVRKSKVRYLRELETLLIRVAKPPGNKKSEPDFISSVNRTKEFKRALKRYRSALKTGLERA